MAALSQMQLQALQRVDKQEKELQRLSTLLLEHQTILQSLPERPCQETPQAPLRKTDQLRHEAVYYLPFTVTENRGAASRATKIPDLNGPPIIIRDTFEGILADAEALITPQRQAHCVRKTCRV